MIELAKQYGKKPVSLKTIEQEQQISRQYLQQLMPPLKREGLIRVVKGKAGGFMLARPPSEIRVGEIIHAQQGEIAIVECVIHGDLCDYEDQCPSREIWVEASRRLNDYFDSLTLEDILKTWKKKTKKKKTKKRS
jgi:Rrf2 family protein